MNFVLQFGRLLYSTYTVKLESFFQLLDKIYNWILF
jgi:hypothetical protein